MPQQIVYIPDSHVQSVPTPFSYGKFHVFFPLSQGIVHIQAKNPFFPLLVHVSILEWKKSGKSTPIMQVNTLVLAAINFQPNNFFLVAPYDLL